MFNTLKISRKAAQEKLISLLDNKSLEYHLELAINLADATIMCLVNDIETDERNHYYKFNVGDTGSDDIEFLNLKQQVLDLGPIPFCEICKTNHFQSGIGRCDEPFENW